MADELPLVGRAAELAVVRDVLVGRERRGLVIAGPAGVGKSRLAAACVALAEDAGWATERVYASRAASSLPFGAFAPLLSARLKGGGTMADVLHEVRDVLSARADGRPLLVWVDDGHVLDDASAMLTYQLAASGEVLVVVTVRTGERAPDPITSLWKEGLAERLDLEPLSRDEVDELTRAALGGAVDDLALRELMRSSEGNALFLGELLAGSLASGVLVESAGRWRLTSPLAATGRLIEIVELRLADLNAGEWTLLELLAIGEPLGLVELAQVASERAVEALERRGLVRVDADDRRMQVRLAHPLYGDVVRARLGALGQRRVAQHLADLLQATGARRADDVLRLATWRLEGGGDVEPATMADAARLAFVRHDFRLAHLLARAAGVAGGFDVELLGARALGLQGLSDEAEEALAELAGRATTSDERLEAAVARVDNLLFAVGDPQLAAAVADAALVDAPAGVLRDELEVYRATTVIASGNPDLGDPVAAFEALEAVEKRAEGSALMAAGSMLGYVLAQVGLVESALAVTERALVATAAANGPVRFQSLAASRGAALVGAGELVQAHDDVLAEYERCLTGQHSEAQGLCAAELGRILLQQGELANAARWSGQAATTLEAVDRDFFAGVALLDRALACAAMGQAEAAASAIEAACQLDVDGRGFASRLAHARAWASVASNDLAAARDLLVLAADDARDASFFALEVPALHDLCRIGHAAEAVDRLEELTTIVQGRLAATRAAHARALVDRDVAALLLAADAFEDMGALLLAAEAAADAAVAANRDGDRRAASAAERRAGALADRCEGASTPALRPVTARSVLTPTEQQIAQLAADGLKSKEIAGRLHLSSRTVDNALQRVYVKLGIKGRGELADALSA